MATPKTPVKSEDLTRSVIPGGTATWYKDEELSPRRSREMDIYEVTLMPKLRQLMVAQKIIGPDGETLEEDNGLGGLPVGITLEESRQLFEMNDTAAWAYLKGWSLKRNGEAVPLPESPSALLDLNKKLYEALIQHAAKITKARITKVDGFSVDSYEDEDSPSGDFDA